MKALFFCTLLVASLKAEQSNWQVVSATAGTTRETGTTWTFTLRNVSGRTLEVGEHWSSKGKASANFCQSSSKFGTVAAMTLLAEPCHHPQAHLDVESGKTITAVVPRIAGYDKDSLSLVIVEGKERVVVAPLSQVSIEGEKSTPAPGPGEALEK